jgi:hypothetical protein
MGPREPEILRRAVIASRPLAGRHIFAGHGKAMGGPRLAPLSRTENQRGGTAEQERAFRSALRYASNASHPG